VRGTPDLGGTNPAHNLAVLPPGLARLRFGSATVRFATSSDTVTQTYNGSAAQPLSRGSMRGSHSCSCAPVRVGFRPGETYLIQPLVGSRVFVCSACVAQTPASQAALSAGRATRDQNVGVLKLLPRQPMFRHPNSEGCSCTLEDTRASSMRCCSLWEHSRCMDSAKFDRSGHRCAKARGQVLTVVGH